MSKLFEYNKIAENNHFAGREEEVKRLSSDFIFLTNTALLSPRGWGKSSLVNMAAKEAMHKEKNLRLCLVSLSNVRNEERFYELLAQSVLRTISNSQEEVAENVRKYFPGSSPMVTFDASGSFTVDFDWKDIRQNQNELLDLPYIVAKDLGLKIIVCIDDFHSISQFNEPEHLLDLFKSRWPRHDGVAYCISSSPLMLVESFLKTAPMFYRYGDIVRLGHIGRLDMVKSIRERFADSAKYLDNDVAGLIVDMVQGHPFYAMQLAHVSWMGTSVVCSREVVLQAFETIADQMDIAFRNITESLTTQQLCYLHAVLDGETVISTSEVLHRHRITSATSASRSKSSLLEKEIICVADGKVKFTDPLYSYWLKNRYFDKK